MEFQKEKRIYELGSIPAPFPPCLCQQGAATSAYDKINWDFMFSVPAMKDFPPKFIDWARAVVQGGNICVGLVLSSISLLKVGLVLSSGLQFRSRCSV